MARDNPKDDWMKVLNINDADLLNRRFNGFDLAPYLVDHDIETSMCVWKNQSNQPNVHRLGPYALRQIPHLPFSWALSAQKCFRETDLAHYHLLNNGYWSIRSMAYLTSIKPSVWTFHDFWPITGGCNMPYKCLMWKYGCKNCRDYPKAARSWAMKKNIYRYSDFDIVVATEWMKKQVEQSPLVDGKFIHVVPFGVNKTFKPQDQRNARWHIGLSQEKFTVMFRPCSKPRKGTDIIVKALEGLDVQVIMFSEYDVPGTESLLGKDLGWTSDWTLNHAYNSADLMLCTSRQDSFNLTAIEAMACGKPVIASSGTGIPEVIGKGGIVLEQKDPNIIGLEDVPALRELILELKDDKVQREILGSLGYHRARTVFTMENYAAKMAEVYRGITCSS